MSPPRTKTSDRTEKEIADAIHSLVLAQRKEALAANQWLAFDVGYIECAEDSNVIGTFATEAEAQAACDKASEEQSKDWHGQHSFEVFRLAAEEAQEGEADHD